MKICPRNWEKFQHFRDRRPPWIKLYRSILDDPDWHELPGEDAKMLVNLWLVASETEDGWVPVDRKTAFRLRMSEKDLKSVCSRLKAWFQFDDDFMITDCHHEDDGMSYQRREEERRETEERAESQRREEHPPIVADEAAADEALRIASSVIKLYSEILPGLDQPKLIPGGKLVEQIKARMKAMPYREDWVGFFQKVARSRFLMADCRVKINLLWLTGKNNFEKVLQGNFDNKETVRPGLSRTMEAARDFIGD